MSSLVLSGPSIINPLPKGKSLGTILVEKLKSYPHDEIALVDADTKKALTYYDVLNLSASVKKVYKKCGVHFGDRVMLVAENSIYYECYLLASILSGTIICPTNPTYTKYEFEHMCKLLQPKLVVVSPISKSLVEDLKPIYGYEILDDEIDLCANDLDSIETMNCIDSTEVLILNSSGTTGLPKGVVHTQKSLKGLLESFERDITEGEHCVLGILPFFHAIGMTGLLQNIYYREKMIVLKKFKPDTFLKSIEQFKITKIQLVPAMVKFLLNYEKLDDYNLGSLKDLLCAGAPIDKESLLHCKQRFNIDVRQGYGMTEFGYCSLTPRGTTFDKHGSIGTLLPGVEGKVVDHNGQSLGTNEKGELCIRTKSNFLKYYRNPEATSETLSEDGFVRTGDLVFYDADGYFYIIDRIKDLIKHKGFQVSPAELEHLLLKHDCVKEAVVIGIPDERTGELPMAYVILKANTSVTELELQEFVARFVSPYKKLTGGVRFVQELPKNATGKFLRRKMKEVYLKELNQ